MQIIKNTKLLLSLIGFLLFGALRYRRRQKQNHLSHFFYLFFGYVFRHPVWKRNSGASYIESSKAYIKKS